MIFTKELTKLLVYNKYAFQRSHRHQVSVVRDIKRRVQRSFSTNGNKAIILGIETSCDDTGCAVMNQDGKILGEAINSQLVIHLRNGGVIPPVAQDLHRKYIEPLVNESIEKARVTWSDIDAIAVTVKPGLPLSLSVGLKYAKYLAKVHSKPIIPIHHMQAHALTARIENDVPFPFLCLLVSGGHCLLAIVNDVNDFQLLGESIDDAPGEAFDKAARRLKLSNVEEFSKLSGGEAIERAAKKSLNPERFRFTTPLARSRDCQFTFSGFKSTLMRHILKSESKYEVEGDALIPHVYDMCAGFQLYIARHLCHRTLRAIEYIQRNDIFPESRQTLVVSGGVACNDFIYNSLNIVCQENGFRLVRPARKMCTDNGIMIAWNGIEKWKKNIDIVHDNIDSIKTETKCPLGTDIREKLEECYIQCKAMRIDQLYKLNHESRV